MKFRKKPVVIEAVQVTDEWFDDDHPNDDHPLGITVDPIQRAVFISTLEGVMRGDVGDWIITGIQGERYPCKPDIFEMTYEYADPDDDPNEDRCGVGISMGELSGLEVELKLEVNGQEGTCHLSPLFYEAIKEHWNELTVEKYGMTYEQCLAEDQARFDEGVKRADALNTTTDTQSEDV